MKAIQIYLRETTYQGKIVFQYSFHKNLKLFKWMLGLEYFKYDRKQKMLYSEATDEVVDMLEIASKGKLAINKHYFRKELVTQAQHSTVNRLNKISIPKYLYNTRLTVKLARVNDEDVFLLTSEHILRCKEVLSTVDFVGYSRRLSAFIIPLKEQYLLKLLCICRGKIFISLHQHVKIQSLYLQSCFWRQCYNTDISVPEEYLKHLKGHNYSTNTIQNYYSSFFIFQYYCFSTGRNINQISPTEINDIVLKISSHNYYSTSATQMMINAVVYYYKNVLQLKQCKNEIRRPQKEKALPKVMAKEDIELLLNSCTNLKHKTMLSILYACGLRAGEIINLKIDDINSKRMLISIQKGKGYKDRTVMLSEKLLQLLKEYYISFKPRIYLFEGQYGDQYSVSSLRQVLNEACKKAGLSQKATLHWLRHSFATHLLEG